jgi:hypothetical protein
LIRPQRSCANTPTNGCHRGKKESESEEGDDANDISEIEKFNGVTAPAAAVAPDDDDNDNEWSPENTWIAV